MTLPPYEPSANAAKPPSVQSDNRMLNAPVGQGTDYQRGYRDGHDQGWIDGYNKAVVDGQTLRASRLAAVERASQKDGVVSEPMRAARRWWAVLRVGFSRCQNCHRAAFAHGGFPGRASRWTCGKGGAS